MRKGRRLAIDVGTVRIGLAICDPDAILCSPVEAIKRPADLQELVEILSEFVSQNEIMEVYVGDPISLSGLTTRSTEDARLVAQELTSKLAIDVRLVDERLTTVTAASKLRDSGRNSRNSKTLIDSESAVVILEQAIHQEKVSGVPAGHKVEINHG